MPDTAPDISVRFCNPKWLSVMAANSVGKDGRYRTFWAYQDEADDRERRMLEPGYWDPLHTMLCPGDRIMVSGDGGRPWGMDLHVAHVDHLHVTVLPLARTPL